MGDGEPSTPPNIMPRRGLKTWNRYGESGPQMIIPRHRRCAPHPLFLEARSFGRGSRERRPGARHRPSIAARHHGSPPDSPASTIAPRRDAKPERAPRLQTETTARRSYKSRRRRSGCRGGHSARPTRPAPARSRRLPRSRDRGDLTSSLYPASTSATPFTALSAARTAPSAQWRPGRAISASRPSASGR